MSGSCNAAVVEAIWPWREAEKDAGGTVGTTSLLHVIVEASVIACVALVLWWVFAKPVLGAVVMAIGAFVAVSGILFPAAYQGFKRLGALLARWVGAGLTWLLLVPFFYICFTGGRVVLLLLRKDPLCRKLSPDQATYWSRHRDLAVPDHFSRQY